MNDDRSGGEALSLKMLLDTRLIESVQVHDYVQMQFSGERTLSVFNRLDTEPSSINMLEGRHVSFVEANDRDVIIRFKEGGEVRIGMDDDSYNGPEAMTLADGRGRIVVWN